MAALRIQMHLHGNAGVLERDVVRQRVVYVVHVVILSLQQERRRRLAGDMEIGVQRKLSIGVRRMRNHKLFDALVRIPVGNKFTDRITLIFPVIPARNLTAENSLDFRYSKSE
jgi:hypothetical protein